MKVITDDFKGDKKDFINHIKTTIFPVTQSKVQERAAFEKSVMGGSSSKGQIEEWTKYINFEISQEQPRRAKLLYERAMSSSIEAENDTELWLRYTGFIQDHLKDASLVRAKFEQKLKYSDLLSAKNKVDILIENATFEEMQSNSLRARKIYE